ncbi:MAG: OsmC family protein [Candidatus Thorarchaeota archaeon]
MTEEHVYEMKSRWVKEKIVTIEIVGKPTIECASPTDFWPERPPHLYSPEDLFLASVVACYGVSIPGIAKRFHAEFNDFEVKAKANLMKGEFGWEFERISISAKITVSTNKDKKKMTKVAERAHRYCVVANSMKCPVDIDAEIILQ